MDAVAEVGRLPVMTRVPGCPAWVSGVANWRGRILAVVDIRVLMGLSAAEADADSTRLVVLSEGDVSVGVVAERVDGVIDVDLESLEPALVTLGDGAVALLAGQLTDDEGPVGVIEADAILALRHRVSALSRRAS
jgi:purine-binding chemotaxis protein CheW